MAIREVPMFTVDCDRCGKNADAEGGDYAGWTDSDDAVERAKEDAGWHVTEDGKHYCWGCMEYDEETDDWKLRKGKP